MNRSASAHVQAFLRDPKGVAALLPTSAPVVERIASEVEPGKADFVIEYGPGTGVLTRRLLDHLSPTARLLAIERDPDLARSLDSELDDPRLTVVRDSAENVRNVVASLALPPADTVLSGIPFFWLTPETALDIVANTHRVLRPGGSLITYQMFYQRRHHLRVHLERCFSTVHTMLDLRNLPPYRICEAVK
ncbi:MAG: class I SAM-dependent methyltransferase [Thermoanaerobaculia bacterium]